MSGLKSLVQASGVLEKKMESVTNNLANVNTVGFKEDQPSFKEILSLSERVVPQSADENFLSHEYLDQYVGMDKSSVIIDEIGKNFSNGRFRVTDNELDLALENEGFFSISTPQGERFTRAGHFKLDGTGQLVTNSGYPVLGENGPILINESGRIEINESGYIAISGNIIDRLKTVRFRNENNLQKLGQNFYAPILSDDVPIPSEKIKVKQGTVEESNVNTVMEMTRMINATRSYEMVQKAITNLDKINEKAISISRIS
jgi:flagellar basal-body rod protein FlgG